MHQSCNSTSSEDEVAPESSDRLLQSPCCAADPTGVYYKTCSSKKIYDTVNACKFCDKIIKQKMKRHLTTVHKKEREVRRALQLHKREGDQTFAKMINEGNFKRNMSVLKRGSGELLLCRRPKRSGIPSERFRPCPGCYGFMLLDDLEKHSKSCVWLDAHGLSVKAQSDVLLGKFEGATGASQVLSGMKDDMRKKWSEIRPSWHT